MGIEDYAPEIEIDQGDNVIVKGLENKNFTVSGTVTDRDGDFRYLKVNGVDVVVDSNGRFSTTVELEMESNTITIVAEDSGNNVTIKTINVVLKPEDPILIGIEEVKTTTTVGTAPKLPELVTAIFNDGFRDLVAVVWNQINEDDYAKAGTFIVEGTVEGTNIKAIAKVTVNPKQSQDPPVTPVILPVNTEPKIESGEIENLKPNVVNGTAEIIISEDIFRKALNSAPIDENGKKTISIIIPKADDIHDYKITLPATALSSNEDVVINIITDTVTMMVPVNMLSNSEVDGTDTVSLIITRVDNNKLNSTLAEQIGGRPVIELNIFAGNRKISWSNKKVPVTVSFKYTPGRGEDSEFITVWYISSDGGIIPVTNARYNAATGYITFTTTHFSKFAVVYVKKTFNDLDGYEWAKHDIEVMASKGIISGTSHDTYNPSANITRADFLSLLIRTLDLQTDFTDNFADVSEKEYYYNAVGIAKELGIVSGVGRGNFEPTANITRQDMMVMTAKALRLAKGLKSASEDILESFTDANKVSDYAKSSVADLIAAGLIKGSENRINPLDYTSRAEAAVIMYRLYNYLNNY